MAIIAPSRTWLAVVLVVGVALAGCVDEPAPEPSPTENDPDATATPKVKTAPGQVVARAKFAANASAVDLQETGSLGNEALCATIVGGPACPEGQVHEYDITEHLPMGARARVMANLTYGGHPEDPLGLGWSAPDDTVTFARSNGGPGWNRLDLEIVRSTEGPVVLRVYRDLPGTPQAADYTLDIQIRDQQRTFHDWEPVGVRVPAGASTLVLNATSAGGFVRMWDPQDTFVGTVALAAHTAIPLPPGEDGEYVLQFRGASPGVDILTVQEKDADAPRLRLLETRGDIVYDVTGAKADETTWTFTLDTQPLFVGLVWGNPDEPHAHMNSWLELWAPDGEQLIGTGSSCMLCIGQNIWSTGAASATAGTYQGVFRSQAAAEVDLGHYVVTYVRSGGATAVQSGGLREAGPEPPVGDNA